jgi:hypothetical protein
VQEEHVKRRSLLKLLGQAAVGLPMLAKLLPMGEAFAANGRASRVIFFYFPDGVAGPSQDGEASLWHPSGSEFSFSLPNQLEPLARHQSRCVFLNGLSMGGTDSGSHPGGAKKLLTGSDGGNGESIDRYLARTLGAGTPHSMLYLGVMANHNNASGDKFISYLGPGQTSTPEDNPLRAFSSLFSGAPTPGGGDATAHKNLRATIIDAVLADAQDFKAQLGAVEARKVDQHLEALREVELRIKADAAQGNDPAPADCANPAIDARDVDPQNLYDPGRFPAMMRMQLDLMVTAMACGLTRVGVVQASQHTSELIMSRFPSSEMYDPGFDMRSHQASHYGPRHDWQKREFSDYVKQRRWYVQQLAALLDRLAARPEGDGTMLDNTLVVMCTEVCDGNTHLHDNMPFVLAGGAGGAVRTGRLLQYGYERHAKLLVSIAHACGQPLDNFGQEGWGGLPGGLG